MMNHNCSLFHNIKNSAASNELKTTRLTSLYPVSLCAEAVFTNVTLQWQQSGHPGLDRLPDIATLTTIIQELLLLCVHCKILNNCMRNLHAIYGSADNSSCIPRPLPTGVQSCCAETLQVNTSVYADLQVIHSTVATPENEQRAEQHQSMPAQQKLDQHASFLWSEQQKVNSYRVWTPCFGCERFVCLQSECSTAQHSTAQHSAAQRSAAQHSAAQRSTAQHSAAQRSAAQRSAAQHTGELVLVSTPCSNPASETKPGSFCSNCCSADLRAWLMDGEYTSCKPALFTPSLA
jgi:hypothetical protein